MNATEMNTKMNTFVDNIQKSVPYDTPNRDRVMRDKYACYIGLLESKLKSYVPTRDRDDVMNDMDQMVLNIIKE